MSNIPDPDQAAEQARDVVLGALSGGPRDSSLRSRRGEQRKRVPAGDDTFRLPRGGLVAMRKSGGFVFSSMEVVVYASGRVTAGRTASAGRVARTIVGQLTVEELAELRRLLEQIDAAEPTVPPGRQNPDGFAYELVWRVGRRTVAREEFDGSISDTVAPLIERLRTLAPF